MSLSNESLNADDVWRERVRLLYAHLPYVLLGNWVAATGLAVAVWDQDHSGFLIGWWGAIALVTGVRTWLWRRQRRQQTVGPHADKHGLYLYAVFAGVSGCVWGSIGVVLFQADPFVLMMLVVVYSGMTAGSVVPHSTWLPAYMAYAIPTVAPFALYAIASGELVYVVVGLLSLTFLGVNIYYGRNLQASVVESIRLRLTNLSLIEELSLGRSRAEAARADAEQAREQAQAADRAKTRFLAVASHDLRQPAQALVLFVDALKRAEGEPRSQELIQNIHSAADSLRVLLSSLMDFASIESGSLKIDVSVFELGPLLQRVVDEASVSAQEQGLFIRLARTRVWVRSDPYLLERIVRNLVSNAVKYTPSGGVLVGCRRKGERIRIVVRDTGPGIAPELHEDIFAEFYQAPRSAGGRKQGVGLGLAIVRGLAQLLGHPVGLSTQPGCGAMFYLDVPIAQPPQRGGARASIVTESDFLDRRVLVVDDDPSILQAISELLLRWGCQVITATSIDEALDRLGGRRPDAIITDHQLHEGETGVGVIGAVRRAFKHDIPATLLAGDITPDVRRAIDSLGVPFAHKPISGGKLRAMLNSMIHQR